MESGGGASHDPNSFPTQDYQSSCPSSPTALQQTFDCPQHALSLLEGREHAQFCGRSRQFLLNLEEYLLFSSIPGSTPSPPQVCSNSYLMIGPISLSEQSAWSKLLHYNGWLHKGKILSTRKSSMPRAPAGDSNVEASVPVLTHRASQTVPQTAQCLAGGSQG